MSDAVNHPQHYGGAEDPYEVIKVIRAWKLGFSLGNAVKYIGRAGKKDPAKHIEDLKKSRWYLDEEIQSLSFAQAPQVTPADIRSRCPTCGRGVFDSYRVHDIASGTSAFIKYECGHAFVGAALAEALKGAEG